MTVIDPNTGLLITCQPWEYAELCKQHGWIKTKYETNTTSIQKYEFTTNTVSDKKITSFHLKKKQNWNGQSKQEEKNDCQ